MDLYVNVTGAHDALSGNGDNSGYVTVVSNAAYYPGATANVVSSLVAAAEYIITELSGATKIRLRLKTAKGNYGYSDMSAYLVADSATIDQVAGVVPVLSNGTIQKKDHV